MAIKKILEAIFEQDFIDTSYRFRPNRSCHDALKKLDKTIMNAPVNFVVAIPCNHIPLTNDFGSFFCSSALKPDHMTKNKKRDDLRRDRQD